ncbi:MAG: Ig-like domain-containing protein [Oscillospiraceae bacterium]|nr:Ig-like domain-containing protein [Oscillospiraceae bacterium]
MAITLFASCTIEEPRSNIPSPTGPPPGVGFDSIEEFHNFLLAVRAHASGGAITRGMGEQEITDLQVAVDILELHEMNRHYMPSWLPEGFRLRSGVGATNWSVGYIFVTDHYDPHKSVDFLTQHEHTLNNMIIFSWTIAYDYTAEQFRTIYVERFNLMPVDGVQGLYFTDFGAYPFVIDLVRSYYWLQDNFVFRLDVPLWVIGEYALQNTGHGRADVGDSFAELVMSSALAVELVDGEYYVEPTGIEIVATEGDVAVGEELELTANVSPANTTINAVIWSSSDSSVAVVSQDGVVTRVGEGSATITARSLVNSDIRATFELGSTGAAEIILNKTMATVPVGDTLTLIATVTPTDSAVTWTSSDESVATVDSSGIVTAVGVGTATITAATADGLYAACEVFVVSASVLPGDVNGDGVVDFLDFLVLIYYLDNGRAPEGVQFIRENADLNGDGVIDDRDLQILSNLLDALG